jgi:hypothetical protein
MTGVRPGCAVILTRPGGDVEALLVNLAVGLIRVGIGTGLAAVLLAASAGIWQ